MTKLHPIRVASSDARVVSEWHRVAPEFEMAQTLYPSSRLITSRFWHAFIQENVFEQTRTCLKCSLKTCYARWGHATVCRCEHRCVLE